VASSREEIFKNDLPIRTHFILVKKYGRSESIFLCQLHAQIKAGSGVLFEDERWIPGTSEDWSEHIGISGRHFQHIIIPLVREGQVRVKNLSSGKGHKLKYYTLGHEANEILDRLFL
jgi:hypothetical protein